MPCQATRFCFRLDKEEFKLKINRFGIIFLTFVIIQKQEIVHRYAVEF